MPARPPVMQAVSSGRGAFVQVSAASSQLSVVHSSASSHRAPAPPQVPVALQVSVRVQNIMSSHAVPAGASGFEQTPAVQTSVEHRSPSAQLRHITPAAPQMVGTVPRSQRVPVQQP